jgi:phage FluMu gp28-like protein
MTKEERAKALFKLMLPYQQRWVADTSRFKIWLKSRQIGGSLGTAFEAVASCVDKPNTDWVVLSAGQRQSEEWMLKGNRVARIVSDAMDLPKPDCRTSEVRFPNGSRILALPANPDTVRGYSANLVLDEFAFHERPDRIYEAIYPAISNPLRGELKLRIISTPAGRNSKFYEIWNKSEELNFVRHKTTIHSAIEEGLPMDIEALKTGLDDPEAWEQEYECEFVDATNVLLPYTLIDECVSDEATQDCEEQNGNAVRFVGIDIGRKHDLTVAWTLEKVGDVMWTREVLVLRNTPYHLQEELLSDRINRATHAAIDSTGIGNAISESLAKRFAFKLEECTFTQGLKAKIFPGLRRAFQERGLRVPRDRAIREDLHSVNELTTPGGNKQYRAVRRSDGHADRCTALALANYAALLNQGSGAIQETDNIMLGRARLAGLRPTLV